MKACEKPSCPRPSVQIGEFCPQHMDRERQLFWRSLTWQERFWASVGKSAGCWEWQGAKTDVGYGTLTVEGRSHLTHRLAVELADGPIAPGLVVCHRCDNPPCVNPAHLFVGTMTDNTADARSKGRLATGARHGTKTHPETAIRGERVGTSKLIETQVLEILATGDSKPVSEIARIYGVSRAAVQDILKGRRWAYLTHGAR